MDALPKHVLANIIGRLDVMDRVQMRAVSSKFRSVVDDYLGPISELVICPDYRLEFFYRFWYTYDEINPKEHFCIVFRLSSFETPVLKHLKKLKFKDDLRRDDLIRLQRFTQLEVLEIGLLAFGDNDETLNFPNLRILCIQLICRPDNKGSYTFNSPFLKAVYFGGSAINHVIPTVRESVEYLEFFHDRLPHKDSLKYRNARIVKCNQVLHLDMHILGKLITELSAMEELHLNLYMFNDLSGKLPFPTTPAVDIRLRVLHDLTLNQMKLRESKRNKAKLDVYLHGVLIRENLGSPDDMFYQPLLNLHYHLSNRVYYYQPTVFAVYYVELVETVRVFRPNDFLKRYPFIEFVEAGQAVKPYAKQFASFLSGLRRVMTVSIRFAGFEQDFYDAMPKIASLRMLTSMSVLDTVKIDLSDTIVQFPYLTVLKTNLITSEAVLNLCETLNMYGDYEFCYKDGHRAVVLKQKSGYSLLLYRRQESLSPLNGALKLYDSQTSSSGFSSEDSALSPPGPTSGPYDEPLDRGYSRCIFVKMNWPELVTKFAEYPDYLRHWFDPKPNVAL